MSVLFGSPIATADELLSDEVEPLLASIATRSDAVVSGHRYLLMVRVRPGQPIQLHHRGTRVGRGPDPGGRNVAGTSR